MMLSPVAVPQRVMSVGLVGPMYAGKSAVRNIIKEIMGYRIITHSDLLAAELRKSRLPVTRENMAKLFLGLTRREGYEALARRAMSMNPNYAFIADGIRNLQEIGYYRNIALGFAVIAVDVSTDAEGSRQIRFERMQRMRRGIDAEMTWERFAEQDAMEMGGVHRAYGIGACMSGADYTLLNGGTLDDLRKSVEELVRSGNFVDLSRRPA